MKITAMNGKQGTITPVYRGIVEIVVEGHTPEREELTRSTTGYGPIGGFGKGEELTYLGSIDMATLRAEMDQLFPRVDPWAGADVAAMKRAADIAEELAIEMDREDSAL